MQSFETMKYIHGPIIVGAGPSGIAVAACLKQTGVPSVILERCDCIASLWQKWCYDRMSLHLPKEFCELPFMGFPESFPKYPTKDQFVSYLKSYAEKFAISPEFNQTVVAAWFDQGTGLWVVDTAEHRRYLTRWLVVATGENAVPAMPEIQGIDKFQGPLFHTCMYKSGSEFRDKRVLVIGCGNSGMEVSFDLCLHNANPHLVVRNSVHVLPREILGISTFSMAMALLKLLPVKLVDRVLLVAADLILGKTENYGLRRPKTGPLELKNATGKTPVLEVGALHQIKAGKIQVVPGVKEITATGAKFVDGHERDYECIIMATGYRSNVPSWLKASDLFKEDGMPKLPFPDGWKGENGLYAVGFTRRGLSGASSDALKVAKCIAEQWTAINTSSHTVIQINEGF